jgi:lambda repressor-like predicted transcriptional regulator
MDIDRAADLYAQGWTLRQIGNELGLSSTTVSDQLRRAGVTLRRAGSPAYSASTHRSLSCATKASPGMRWPNRSI